MNDTPLPTLMEAFATYNRAQGHSPRTVSWYTESLEEFIRHLQSQGRRAVLAALDEQVQAPMLPTCGPAHRYLRPETTDILPFAS